MQIMDMEPLPMRFKISVLQLQVYTLIMMAIQQPLLIPYPRLGYL